MRARKVSGLSIGRAQTADLIPSASGQPAWDPNGFRPEPLLGARAVAALGALAASSTLSIPFFFSSLQPGAMVAASLFGAGATQTSAKVARGSGQAWAINLVQEMPLHYREND